jgi:hypothetical protein
MPKLLEITIGYAIDSNSENSNKLRDILNTLANKNHGQFDGEGEFENKRAIKYSFTEEENLYAFQRSIKENKYLESIKLQFDVSFNA